MKRPRLSRRLLDCLRGAAGRVGRANTAGIVALLAACAVFLLHARSYLPFFADDAFISLRYARRLLDGEGLTWNAGERVEGYSNLLWVLCSAGLGALGVDLVSSARLLGQATGLAAVAGLVVAYWPKAVSPREVAPGAAAATALALSGPAAVWAVGGLEQPLVAACLVWGVYLVFRLLDRDELAESGAAIRGWVVAGIPFALLVWTRPDGPLLAVAVAVGVAATDRFDRVRARRALWLILLPAVFVVAQLVFRKLYYDAWIPNSGAAKLAFTAERWGQGWIYVRGALDPFKALFLLACTAGFPFAHDIRARRRLVVVLTPFLAWLVYVVAVGGDIFPAWRHLLVLVVLACFALAEGVRWILRARPRHRFWTLAGLTALLALYLADQRWDEQNARARHERWEWDGEVIGTFLHKHFEPRGAVLATDSAGALPYFARLTTVDMLGINDRYIATHPPADFGHGALGHELGDGTYVASREPDLIVFGLPTGQRDALYPSGLQMQRDPTFARTYSLISFEATNGRTVRAQMWARVQSARLGFERGADRVVVPGFLLAVGKASAREDGSGRLGTVVSRFAPGAVRVPDVPPGDWYVQVVYDGVEPELSVQAEGDEPVIGPAPLALLIEGKDPRDVNVALRPEGGGLTHVREVVLRRSVLLDPTSD